MMDAKEIYENESRKDCMLVAAQYFARMTRNAGKEYHDIFTVHDKTNGNYERFRVDVSQDKPYFEVSRIEK